MNKKKTEQCIEDILLEKYDHYYRMAYSYTHNEADAQDIVQNGAYKWYHHFAFSDCHFLQQSRGNGNRQALRWLWNDSICTTYHKGTGSICIFLISDVLGWKIYSGRIRDGIAASVDFVYRMDLLFDEEVSKEDLKKGVDVCINLPFAAIILFNKLKLFI